VPEHVQPVTDDKPTEWHWQVRPKEAGNRTLYLVMDAIVKTQKKSATGL
jgi:hypothetical protein